MEHVQERHEARTDMLVPAVTLQVRHLPFLAARDNLNKPRLHTAPSARAWEPPVVR